MVLLQEQAGNGRSQAGRRMTSLNGLLNRFNIKRCGIMLSLMAPFQLCKRPFETAASRFVHLLLSNPSPTQAESDKESYFSCK